MKFKQIQRKKVKNKIFAVRRHKAKKQKLQVGKGVHKIFTRFVGYC